MELAPLKHLCTRSGAIVRFMKYVAIVMWLAYMQWGRLGIEIELGCFSLFAAAAARILAEIKRAQATEAWRPLW